MRCSSFLVFIACNLFSGTETLNISAEMTTATPQRGDAEDLGHVKQTEPVKSEQQQPTQIPDIMSIEKLALEVPIPFAHHKPEVSFIDRDGVIVPEEFPYHKEIKLFNKAGAGKLIGSVAISKQVSKFAGWLQNRQTPFSLKWQKFAAKHKINLDECIVPEGGFATFNEFFTRKLKDNARPIDQTPGGLVSPADSKVTFVENVSKKDIFIIKSSRWSLQKMLGSASLAELYKGGTLISFRLAPEDYHRFHFPCDARPSFSQKIAGTYNSVNPYVFKHGHDPLGENARNIVVLKSEQFNDPLCIIVGAMGVGKIVETFSPQQAYKKGDEMGYFEFGASTVCLLFKPGVIKPAADRFIHNSKRMIETAVKCGELIATATSAAIKPAPSIAPTFVDKIWSLFSL